MKTWIEGNNSFLACALQVYGVAGCVLLLCMLCVCVGMGIAIVAHMI